MNPVGAAAAGRPPRRERRAEWAVAARPVGRVRSAGRFQLFNHSLSPLTNWRDRECRAAGWPGYSTSLLIKTTRRQYTLRKTIIDSLTESD